ncbi:MAG: SRPBCC domain-containing protein [Pseudomonadota bacterium]
MNELSLSVTKIINASIQRTFDAWLDKDHFPVFMRPKADMPNPTVTLNPVVGGEFEILMQVGDNQVPHRGEYLEIERPHRLVFSWKSGFAGENSVVSISFAELSFDQTEVTLTHTKLPSDESVQGHTEGWVQILKTLSECAS